MHISGKTCQEGLRVVASDPKSESVAVGYGEMPWMTMRPNRDRLLAGTET